MIRRLASARDGATIIEFAMLAPVLVMVVFGLFDMGFNIYAQTMLQGAVQEAARSSTVQGAATNLAATDQQVRAAVQAVIPGATVTPTRTAYTNFTDVQMPEDFTDTNHDGKCDNGEPYEDANGNGSWDADRGTAGLGGARDAVLYKVSVTYPRVFPMARLIGLPNTVSLQAETVLRNQPYAEQVVAPAQVRNCS